MSTHNPVGWFEVPVLDMDRAITFYEAVLGVKLERHQMGPLDMAWFPMKPDATGAMGTLVKHPDWYRPSSTDGVVIYFTSPTGDLNADLAKVEASGGKIVVPRKEISPEFGFMAVILDSEGNRVSLHSRT